LRGGSSGAGTCWRSASRRGRSPDGCGIAALAREYEVAMRKYVGDMLGAHLPDERLGPAMELFMGDHAPHD